jgi:hypothetical protein
MPGHWKRFVVNDSVSVANESPGLFDVDGDGRMDILCGDAKTRQMVWLQAPLIKGETTWKRYAVSERGVPGTEIYSHGLGLGDINKDGRKDIMIRQGWWEAPENRKQPNWIYHPADFGEDCSHMHVMDVNGDGLNDVISASAHHYGVLWYEQKKDGPGQARWIKHEISKTLSQTHSSILADINGDGNADLVTGKRYFAHNDTDVDPGTHDPALLLWFEFIPGKKPYWKSHEIDNDSGAGLNISIADMNKDGSPDIIIANKKGVFVFENNLKENRKRK